MAPKVNNLVNYFGNDMGDINDVGGNQFSANYMGNFNGNEFSTDNVGNFNGENSWNYSTTSGTDVQTSVLSKIKNSFGEKFTQIFFGIFFE